jgi:Lrp/AsnC family leucine-responsive transcriptional regulator
METLDDLDKSILKILQKNAQLGVKAIADIIGLSASPTYERIKRMEKSGLIIKYVALLNREKIDQSLVAFCNVMLKDHTYATFQHFEKAIKKFEEVIEIHCTSGGSDYLLKIVTRDMKSYQDFIMNKLPAVENIAHMQSFFSIKELKYETAYKLV